MIFWLDNHENHRDAVNENWGRELLELFSMGVSNYTEVDVRECSRAFTGWTISPKIPRLPYGRFPWRFEYKEEDHDDGEKVFLGEQGDLNGEDIIDIVVEQPATARFICRHLYNFFVADEVQVPAWTIEPARDEEALDCVSHLYPLSIFGSDRQVSQSRVAPQPRVLGEYVREPYHHLPEHQINKFIEIDCLHKARLYLLSLAGFVPYMEGRDYTPHRPHIGGVGGSLHCGVIGSLPVRLP